MSGTKEKLVQLKKKLGESDDAEQLKDCLKQLQKMPVTSELLKETRIGVTIAKLKKHKDNEVCVLSMETTKGWRNLSASGLPRIAAQAAAKAADEAAETKAKAETAAAVAEIATTGSAIRDRLRKLLDKALRAKEYKGGKEAKAAAVVACEVEAALYSRYGGENDDYKAQYRAIAFNLKDKNNIWLHEQVMDGTLTAARMVAMTSEQMASQDIKKRLEEVRKEDFEAAKGKQVEQAETDMFKCGKCKERRTTYFQMQTRSADEPMTTF
eukprot:CAMPEP_0114619240 /NCGR_PEP_ID=MMETSP0168-20121206/8113_1 /TAXON_ID=95228 ORGANISM="Vannella sp., Strain DIVA3 517/6/12" /NCGR_SAMPLE_ID=MMETSP0168 /ASSEMBLY_ACC=CAM_ASM_000044 /LENGTH=267 /DNA_ID=CAMNT_0001830405 /DNA_START=33 /DNA_END=833 /DNA_ORIENTATION=-